MPVTQKRMSSVGFIAQDFTSYFGRASPYGFQRYCRNTTVLQSTLLEDANRHDPRQSRRSARAQRDDALQPEIQRVWDEQFQVYGPRKVWKQLRREGFHVARCTVRRLMRARGLAGAVRGRAWVTTTRPVDAPRPNQLWVSDFNDVATWAGFVYVAFVVDVFARRIVGWRVSASLRTAFVLDALEQAIYARSGDPLTGLVHHSDSGCQYTSYAFGKRCREAGVMPSMGSTGDAYDNAMAESFFATLEREVLNRRRFQSQTEARMAIFQWLEGWYNPHRRHSALGYLSPINYERRQLPATA